MAKKKNKHHEEEGGEAWLLPYSDLMTLLLAVFIVLFAVSKMDSAKAQEIAETFRETMMTGGSGVLPGKGTSAISGYPESSDEINSQGENTNNADASTSEDENTGITKEKLEKFMGKYELKTMMDLKSRIDKKLQNTDLNTSIETRIDMRGLVITLNNAILFESGSAEVKEKNRKVLLEIADGIRNINNYIRIEGHTDNIPIHSGIYPSNWELSTARAASVVRLFIEQGNISPDKLEAVGYGEYKPVANNSSNDSRAKNRRIEVIILSQRYNNLEK